MAPSSRDRLSVDLHGLKAALLDRAKSLGVTPSGFVRSALAEALGRSEKDEAAAPVRHHPVERGDRVRICLRMRGDCARAAVEAARQARITPADYIGGLIDGVPVLTVGGSRADHIAALVASSAELATLGRNLHRLTVLLGRADVEPARTYREMLDTVGRDVRQHLHLAAAALAELQPQRRQSAASASPDRR